MSKYIENKECTKLSYKVDIAQRGHFLASAVNFAVTHMMIMKCTNIHPIHQHHLQDMELTYPDFHGAIWIRLVEFCILERWNPFHNLLDAAEAIPERLVTFHTTAEHLSAFCCNRLHSTVFQIALRSGSCCWHQLLCCISFDESYSAHCAIIA